MAGDEDDANVVFTGSQGLVQIEAARPRHPNVEHETAGGGEVGPLQEFARRGERLHGVAGGAQEQVQGTPDGEVIVHHEDGRSMIAHAAVSSVTGKLK